MAATLQNRALQHYASDFSICSSMQPARSLQEEDTYFDDGLIPRALNIRRPYLHENVTSATGGYMNRFGTAEERQDKTPKGQLRVVSPDVDVDHASYHQRRAAIYLPSPAQQALQCVLTPQRPTSVQSYRSRLTSLGSEFINTVRKHKPKQTALSVSSNHKLPRNPLQAPSAIMSRPDSLFAGDRFSRSISISSNNSSVAGPSDNPLPAVTPYAYAEPARVRSADCLTLGGLADATLSLNSYTTISTLDKPNNPPEVTVWVFVQVKASKFYEGLNDNNNPEANIPPHDERQNWSHGQINNLSMEITLPQGFDIVCVLGHLQQSQVKLGEHWSVVFKLQLHKKFSVTKFLQRAENTHPGTLTATDRLTAARLSQNPQIQSYHDRGMGEKLFSSDQEVSVAVQYSRNRFPTNLLRHISTTSVLSTVPESQRRRRQQHEQRGQPSLQEYGSNTLITSANLAGDLIVGDTIIGVLSGSQRAILSKNGKSAAKFTGVPAEDALHLLKDFQEAAGATLPQSMSESMADLRSFYEQEREQEQERAPARKASGVVRFARRAVSSGLSGRRRSARLDTDSTENLISPAGPLGDITNQVREEDGEITAI